MPISQVHSSHGGNNKGSCSALANYLEKENAYLDKLANEANDFDVKMNLENRKESFFSAEQSNIGKTEIVSKIDSNKKKLSKIDAKFFAPTLNFSDRELRHLAEKATGKADIKNVWEMKANELKKYNEFIKAYTRKAMDNYAKNFNRQNKGLNSGKDLVYYAKIEHQRTFKGTDKEVRNGLKKSGEFKEGFQSHVHVIVSRKDKTQRLKLSPTANEKNTTRSIGGNNYKVGFDRKKWITNNEESFDKMFEYKRQEQEKFRNLNIMKNGTEKEKENLQKNISNQKKLEKINQLEL